MVTIWKIISTFFIWKRNFRVFFLGLWWEGISFENGISVSFWVFLENNASTFYLKTGFAFFWTYDGNLWKIIPISSIWKWNFRVFSGLVMEISFENGNSMFIWIFLENNANIFYLKTGFPFFWAYNGNLWKIMPISSIWKRDFRFFLTCDGNLWKIISISSIWNRNFRIFSGLVMGTSFENGISVFFCSFLENNDDIFYLKTGFPFFWICDGNLWKIISIFFIWKRNFRVFSGFVMGSSFENGISVSFQASGK